MKHILSLNRFAAVLSVAAVFTAAAQQLVICTGCSWELAGGARFCSNCGQGRDGERVVPQVVANDDVQIAPEPNADRSVRATSSNSQIIAQDIAWAREFRTGGNNAAAFAALANARAVISVSPADAVSEDDRRFIFDGSEALRKDLRLSSPAACPACKGTGIMEIPTEVRSLAGTTPMAIPRQKESCKFCAGKGRIFRYQPATIRSQMTAGEREYARVAQIAGYKLFPRSTVYMPDNLAAALTKDQTNLLSRTSVTVCASCAGFGHEACAPCTGIGIVKCPDKDCVNGIVKETPAPVVNNNTRTGTVRAQPLNTQTITKRCDACKGAAFIACPACGGTSAVPCRRCNR